MKKKILNLKNPIVSCYNYYGTLFSLISDDPKILPWICNNFIQIKYEKGSHVLFFDRYYSSFDHVPAFRHYKINRKYILNKYGKSIVKLLIELIETDSYVSLYVDRYYLFKEYRKRDLHAYHELFIYGYDAKKNEFYCKDNSMEGSFVEFKISFDDLDLAYWAIDSWPFYTSIHYLGDFIELETSTKLNFPRIKTLFSDYAKSIETINYFEHNFFETGDHVYGINAIKQHVFDCKDNMMNPSEFKIDIRVSHLLYEHKLLMVMRLNYMKDNDYLQNSEKIIEQYEGLQRNYFDLRNFALKCNIKNKKELFDDYITKMEKQIDCEEKLIKDLLCLL